MNSEEQFKKSLNDLLSSKEFSFEEDNWAKARGMIDASKKGKKRAILIIVTAVLVLCTGIGSVFLFQQTKPMIAEAPIGKSIGQVTSQNPELAHFAAPDNKDNTLPDSNPVQDDAKSVAVSSGSAVFSLKKITVPAQGTSTATPEDSGKLMPAIVASENHSSSPVPAKQNNPAALPFIAAQHLTTQPPPTPTGKTPEHTPANPESKIVAPEVPETKNEALYRDSSHMITPTIPGTLIAMEPFNEKSVMMVNNPDSLTRASIESNTLTTNAGLAPAISKPDTDYVKRKKPTIMLEAGASFLFGWETEGNKEAAGINPALGINYLTTVSPVVSLGFGIQYTSVGHLKYNSFTSKISKLNFGEESDVTVYSPKTLHYLMLPLRVNYRLDRKNTIGLGSNIAYLLTVTGEIEEYYQTNGGISDVQSSKSIGYTQGFKPFDLQLAGYYKRNLYKNYYGRVEFFYGLSSVRVLSFFPYSAYSRNLGLKLTLVYDIFKNY